LYTHTHAHLYVKHEYEIIITGIISPHETYIILTGDEKNIRIYTYTSYAIGNSRELLQTAQRIVWKATRNMITPIKSTKVILDSEFSVPNSTRRNIRRCIFGHFRKFDFTGGRSGAPPFSPYLKFKSRLSFPIPYARSARAASASYFLAMRTSKNYTRYGV